MSGARPCGRRHGRAGYGAMTGSRASAWIDKEQLRSKHDERTRRGRAGGGAGGVTGGARRAGRGDNGAGRGGHARKRRDEERQEERARVTREEGGWLRR